MEGVLEGDKVGWNDSAALGADEILGVSLGLALGEAETLGFSEGKEECVLDNEGDPEGTAADKLG